jgi:hypothetical protein
MILDFGQHAFDGARNRALGEENPLKCSMALAENTVRRLGEETGVRFFIDSCEQGE